jgi:DNA-binding MarR family transcriptional regulator
MRDPLKSYPGYLLRRASSALTAELTRRLADLDLRIAEMSVLLLVGANPGITQSELGRLLDIQRANMTPLAVRLRDRGLITRQAVDGRSQGLALTGAGTGLASQARAIAEHFEHELVDRVPAHLRPHVLPILSALWLGEN